MQQLKFCFLKLSGIFKKVFSISILNPRIQNPQKADCMEVLVGFSQIFIQMVATISYSLKARSLKMTSITGKVGRMHIPRTGVGEEPTISRVKLLCQLVVTLISSIDSSEESIF